MANISEEQVSELLSSLKSIAASLEKLANCVQERETSMGTRYSVFQQRESVTGG